MLERHVGDATVVERGLQLLRSMAWGAATPTADIIGALPTALSALARHSDIPAVAEHGLAFLRNVAYGDGSEGVNVSWHYYTLVLEVMVCV
jgi:hypothetical protein